MAVKGETDPAARAHIDSTSSRKPAVVEATPGRGGAGMRMLVIICSSCWPTFTLVSNGKENTKHIFNYQFIIAQILIVIAGNHT